MSGKEENNVKFDRVWEEEIYSKGMALNKYPYGELVSVLFQALKYLDDGGKRCRVLEIGCGGGNNLWFMAELGFDVYGIDGSESALKAAERLFKDRGLEGEFKKAYFEELPFSDGYFDIVIDRGGTVCCDYCGVKRAWEEGGRVLRKDGVFISFMLNENHPVCKSVLSDAGFEKTEEQCCTLRGLKVGDLDGLGCISFIRKGDLKEIFSFGDILEVREHSLDWIFPVEKADMHGYSEFIIVGRKTNE